MTQWTDNVRVDLIRDKEEALESIREAHAWATRELQTATEPIRRYNLDLERKRLARQFAIVKNPTLRWKYPG